MLLSLAVVFSLQLSARQNLTIMTYNVENLFDWTHDAGKKDYTYMPKATKDKSKTIQNHCRSISHSRYRSECFNLDWKPSVVRAKMHAIAAMIRSGAKGGPDVIVFNEVENENVLNMLVQFELADLGYRTIELLEGPDVRGIDVAVVSKWPLAKASKIHKVKLPGGKKARPTRPVLEVHLNINNKDVAIFANHWPSQGNPTRNRVAAAKTLYEAALAAGTPYVFAAGDFNTIKSERNSGLSIILDPKLTYHFLDSLMYTELYADNAVEGTHWYRGDWDFLDRILILNTAFKQKESMVLNAVRIVSPDFALIKDRQHRELRPSRFDPRSKTGVSDHLPLVLSFSL